MLPPRAEPAHRRGLRLRLSVLAGMLLAGVAGPAGAQQAAGLGLRLSPYASAELTLTDNVSQSTGGKAADAVTRWSAGVVGRSPSGPLRGDFDYSVSALLYAQSGSRSTFQQRLAAQGEWEWQPRQGYLAAAASIQQEARSAFGAPARANGLPGDNTTEVRSLRLAPRWRGLMPGGLQLRLGGEAAVYSAQATDAGDVRTLGASAQLSPLEPAPLSWALDFQHQASDYSLTRNVRGTRAFASVLWLLNDLDLLASAQAGVEQANYTSLQQTQKATGGVGLQWQPSPRTRVQASLEERVYGRSHRVSVEYRTPRTVWLYADSRAVGAGGTSLGIGQRGRAFDILFAQFASIEPDFARRAALVEAELARAGIRSDAILYSTFLRSAMTIDDRREASVAWRGQRMTVLFNASQTHSRRLDMALVGGDDLDTATRLRQNTLSLAVNHKLTPQTYAGLTVQRQSARGDLLTQQARSQGFSARLGGRFRPEDFWSLTFTWTAYETTLVPSTETALTAIYGLRF